MNAFQIILVTFIAWPIILSVIFYLIKIKKIKSKDCFTQGFELIENTVLTIFANVVIVLSIKDLDVEWHCFLLIIIIYAMAVLLLKFLIVCRCSFKCKHKNFKPFVLLFASIDYSITGFIKSFIDDEEKSIVLKRFNIINLFLSLFLITLFLLLSSMKIDSTYLLVILIIRIVYRLFEIIISFLKDIVDTNKSSSLKIIDRIRLALLSLLEVFALYFGYCLLSDEECSFYKALKVLLFQDVCNESIISILVALTSMVMVGTVIVQYISDKKN